MKIKPQDMTKRANQRTIIMTHIRKLLMAPLERGRDMDMVTAMGKRKTTMKTATTTRSTP